MQERMDMLEAVAERAARAASMEEVVVAATVRRDHRLPGSMSRKLDCMQR